MTVIEHDIWEMMHNTHREIQQNPQIDLLAQGIIDSFDIADIVSQMESKFEIEIKAEDIVPENFNSIAVLARLVQRYRQNKD